VTPLEQDLLDALRGLADAVEAFVNNPEDWPELSTARAVLARVELDTDTPSL
jgi:hypothetical protein